MRYLWTPRRCRRCGPSAVPLSQVLLDLIGEGVCLAEGDGRVLWANRFFESLPEDIRARHGRGERRVGRVASGPSDRGRGLTGRALASCKFELVSDQTGRVFEIFISPVIAAGTGAGSRVERLAILVRDVTAASRIRVKMDAISRAGSELVRIEADAIRKMNVVERLGLLEQKIVRHTRELIDFDRLVIRLMDEPTRRLELVMTSGNCRGTATECYAEPEGAGSRRVASTGRSYLCRDTLLDESATGTGEETRSTLTVPLLLHDRRWGHAAESDRAAAYTEEDLQFLEIVAARRGALHMLDLLIVERSAVNQTVTGRVEGELAEPLADLAGEILWLDEAATNAPEMASHVARIRADVESIRRRIKDCAAGPQTLLGVDRALASRQRDPALIDKRILIADNEEKIRRIIADAHQPRVQDHDRTAAAGDRTAHRVVRARSSRSTWSSPTSRCRTTTVRGLRRDPARHARTWSSS